MLTCCWHPCLPDSVIFTLSSLFRGSYAHPYLKLSFNDACLCKQYGSPTVAPSALPSQTAERMWEFLNYIWFAHYGEIVFSFHFFFFFLRCFGVLCWIEGHCKLFVCRILAKHFLPAFFTSVHCLWPLLQGSVCLWDLLLIQVQRWTKITSPSTFLCPFNS